MVAAFGDGGDDLFPGGGVLITVVCGETLLVGLTTWELGDSGDTVNYGTVNYMEFPQIEGVTSVCVIVRPGREEVISILKKITGEDRLMTTESMQ